VQAASSAAAGTPLPATHEQITPPAPAASVPPEVVARLAQVFARSQDESHLGLTPGFLEGSQHQRLVRGRAPRHRGLCLGRISGVCVCVTWRL
jgi:hypothetical protein